MEAAPDALLGSMVGRFRVERVLGAGGMGTVYLAVQPEIGSRVAIKVLSEECARNPELLERFFAEARAVNLVQHEHIVSVIDLARLPDGRPFIVMEFVEGQTLGALVRGGPAPLGGIAQVMGEVLGALAAAHAIGIVHRDLKPDNILVTAQGHAKVLDFGIAKLAPGLGSNSPRTQTGALMGTPAYMAPEQISGAQNVDARSDVYAAGVVLYEAVIGRPPFSGATLFDLMRAHLEQAPPSPRALRPELPAALEAVILTALAKDPAQRFQSAQAMAQAMQHACAELPAASWRSLSARRGVLAVRPPGQASVDALRSTAVAAPPTAARTRRRGLVAIAAGLAAGVAVIVVWQVMSSRGPDPATVVSTAGSAAAGAAGTGTAGGTGTGTAAGAGTGAGAGTAAGAGTGTAAAAGAGTGAAAGAGAAAGTAAGTGTGAGTGAGTGTGTGAGTGAGTGTAAAAGARAGAASVPAGVPAPARAPAPVTPPAVSHGVVIGPNVHVGPNVIIGTGTGTGGGAGTPTHFTRPADYNPKHFDALAYAPRALALARSVFPDAGLARFDVMGVYPDGHADLTLGDDDTSYLFRSPSHSGRPAGIPANADVEVACYVEVTVHPREVDVRVRADSSDSRCTWPLRPIPRCSTGQVWSIAKTRGAHPDTVAKVEFLSDGQWFFDNTDENNNGLVETIPDRCR